MFFEILRILSNFLKAYSPIKLQFWSFLLEKYSLIHKIGGFGCKNSSKFEENSKINIYYLVPQIEHHVLSIV